MVAVYHGVGMHTGRRHLACGRPARKDAAVELPSPETLFERLQELPAAEPLARLGDSPPVFLVGGSVRDLLLGRAPSELDLVVEGDAAEVAGRIGGKLIVHDRFGTSTVWLDGVRYDLARARRETYPRPGALPEVEPASLEEDLHRRDFTVNAIALGVSGPETGVLQAVAGALEDLRARQLRVLHEESFVEDPTRLLRLARYRGRLGFAIEPHTYELARAAAGAAALDTVSGARLGAELRLLASERDPVSVLESFGELGLEAAIHPWFGLRDFGLARRALDLLPVDGRPALLVLALASREIPAHELRQALDRLAFTASERETIVTTAREADALASALADAGAPSEIASAVGPAPAELVAVAGALGPAEAASEWLEHGRHVRLEIDGSDLVAAGVPEGPAVGDGLRAALYAKLDGRVSDREAELAEALRAARRRPSAAG